MVRDVPREKLSSLLLRRGWKAFRSLDVQAVKVVGMIRLEYVGFVTRQRTQCLSTQSVCFLCSFRM